MYHEIYCVAEDLQRVYVFICDGSDLQCDAIMTEYDV